MAKRRPKARNNTLAKMECRKLKMDIFECHMRGMRQVQIAQRHGITQGRVSQIMDEIYNEWITPDGETYRSSIHQFNWRMAQLQNVRRVAYESFERSRQDAVEHTMAEAICSKCEGKGIDPDNNEWCETCKGDGTVRHTVNIKVKGQAGDVAFLKLAKDCLIDEMKLEGLYKKAPKQVVNVQVQQTRLEDVYKDVPGDVIIEAKMAMEKLAQASKDAAKQQVIEGRVVPKGSDDDYAPMEGE